MTGFERKQTYSLMFVLLSPVVLQRSVWALIGGSYIGSGSSRILQKVSFLWIVRQTLDGHWDFANGDVVLLARGKITDLVLEERQKRV